MDNIIETHQLKKSFRVRHSKDRELQIVEAVRGIDLAVRVGEIFGFLGLKVVSLMSVVGKIESVKA